VLARSGSSHAWLRGLLQGVFGCSAGLQSVGVRSLTGQQLWLAVLHAVHLTSILLGNNTCTVLPVSTPVDCQHFTIQPSLRPRRPQEATPWLLGDSAPGPHADVLCAVFVSPSYTHVLSIGPCTPPWLCSFPSFPSVPFLCSCLYALSASLPTHTLCVQVMANVAIEEVCHLLPAVKRLHVTLVGPEWMVISPGPTCTSHDKMTCPPCKNAGCKRIISIYR